MPEKVKDFYCSIEKVVPGIQPGDIFKLTYVEGWRSKLFMGTRSYIDSMNTRASEPVFSVDPETIMTFLGIEAIPKYKSRKKTELEQTSHYSKWLINNQVYYSFLRESQLESANNIVFTKLTKDEI